MQQYGQLLPRKSRLHLFGLVYRCQAGNEGGGKYQVYPDKQTRPSCPTGRRIPYTVTFDVQSGSGDLRNQCNVLIHRSHLLCRLLLESATRSVDIMTR